MWPVRESHRLSWFQVVWAVASLIPPPLGVDWHGGEGEGAYRSLE